MVTGRGTTPLAEPGAGPGRELQQHWLHAIHTEEEAIVAAEEQHALSHEDGSARLRALGHERDWLRSFHWPPGYAPPDVHRP
jgi:hypothetical protein